MDQQLKQRLVGAITIVSLLVIFLPVIFDGSGYKQLLHLNLDTPAQPHLIIEQEFKELPELGNRSVKEIYETINPNQNIEVAQWKIQVGVFEQEVNAKAYLATLMAKQYSAEYRKAQMKDGVYFVVDVVAADKKQLQAMKARLEKDMGLKQLVVERR